MSWSGDDEAPAQEIVQDAGGAFEEQLIEMPEVA
jgi:hypothetical protein